jgi:hypothetical protein
MLPMHIGSYFGRITIDLMKVGNSSTEDREYGGKLAGNSVVLRVSDTTMPAFLGAGIEWVFGSMGDA